MLPETELKELREAQRSQFRFSVHPHSKLGVTAQGFVACCVYFKVLYPQGNTLSLALESAQPNFDCEASYVMTFSVFL